MLISRPSYQEILNNLIASIQVETGIDASPDSSIMGAIARTFAYELDKLYDRQEALEKASYLSTAEGDDLDRIGALYGVARKQPTVSSTIGMARAVQFTNNTGGTVNITIGTRVWPELTPDKAFIVTESGVLLAGGVGLMHVKATGEGGYFNLSSRSISRHNLPFVDLKVTNILPISNGQGRETDSDYRYRIQQELTRREGLNQENLSSALRSIPGLSDVLILPLQRGPGTIDVIIVPSQRGDEYSLLDKVQELVAEILPVGISYRVMLPTFRILDLEAKIAVKPNSIDPIDVIRSDVRTSLSSYVDSIPMETGYSIGTFSGSEALVRVLTANNNILNATLLVALDGRPMASNSLLSMEIGERLVLRNLSVI